MKTYYLDTSVALRFLFRQPNALDIPKDGELISSAIFRVECFRTLGRIYQLKQNSPDQILEARTAMYMMFDTMKLVDVNRIVLERASQAFEFPIKTLDAIHLSTAMLYREEFETPVTMLTHDQQLSRAAQMQNIKTQGC